MNMKEEIRNHLVSAIIPFWKNLRDDEFGGYYGYMDYDLKLNKKAKNQLQKMNYLLVKQRLLRL